jgi:tetratricopeptide (TPR) repeat protein
LILLISINLPDRYNQTWKSGLVCFFLVMLRKSLVIASILLLSTASAGWSIDQSSGSQLDKAPQTRQYVPQALWEKLSRASAERDHAKVERLARQILRRYPNDRSVIIELGYALVEQRKFGQADNLYRQQIAKNSLDLEMYLALCHSLEAQDRPDEALALYRQALSINEANGKEDLHQIHEDIVRLLFEVKRYDEGIAYGRQRLVDSNNENEISNIGSNLVVVLQQQGRIDESITLLREIIAKKTFGDNFFSESLGQLLIQKGKDVEAIEVYQAALATSQVDRNPFDQGRLYLSLGRLLKKQQRLPEALAIFRKLIADPILQKSIPKGFQVIVQKTSGNRDDFAIDPAIDFMFPFFSAQVEVNEILHQQQGWKAVQQEMRSMEKANSEMAAYAWQRLGNKLFEAEKYSDTVLAYQRSLQLDRHPVGISFHRNQFLAYTFLDQPQKAQVAYQQTLKLTPKAQRPALIKTWAFILDKSGRKAEAIPLYRQLLKSPDKEELLISLQLANALAQNGQTTEANEVYLKLQTSLNKLLQVASPDPNTYTMQGNLFGKRQQYPAAIASYRQAIKSIEKQTKKDLKLLSFNQLKLADNLRITGQQTEAIDLYHQAIQGCNCTEIKAYQPSTLHSMAYHGLGLSLEQQGKLTEAKTAFQKALELDPSYQEAQESLQRITANPKAVI